jgi:response regulator RpfG family c-di-GMP phosphodiesterase
MTDADRRELRMAALLHDVGKIITPAHVLDKRTKLQAITDRIELIRARFAALRVAAELDELKDRVRAAGHEDLLVNGGDDEALKKFEENSRGDLEFLESCNRGDLFVDAKALARINDIAARAFQAGEAQIPAISPEERDNLAIRRGTLSPEERKIMEEHVSISIRLLRSLPWPKDLQRVTEYAGGHHENVNGTGYPKGLTGEQMPVPARILAIADRFEGISAPDRPYRRALKLSKVMAIMQAMRDDNEIDADLFDLFVAKKVYLNYARRHLDKSLIDCD